MAKHYSTNCLGKNGDEIGNLYTFPRTIKIKDLVTGFSDTSHKQDGDVHSYVTFLNEKGKEVTKFLNIRPKYQREYIVGGSSQEERMWRDLLIDSILHGFSINKLYFGVCADGTLEVIDGQQRLITLLRIVTADDSKYAMDINGTHYTRFAKWPAEYQNKVLEYELDVDMCVGTESERIAYFKRINRPNHILSNQELRNAAYTGKWLSAAKEMFSRKDTIFTADSNDPDGKYVNPLNPINFRTKDSYGNKMEIDRQGYLEFAISLVAAAELYANKEMIEKAAEDTNQSADDLRILAYMDMHFEDENADDLVEKYTKIVTWIVNTFCDREGMRKEEVLKEIRSTLSNDKVNWGELYAKYNGYNYNTRVMSNELAEYHSLHNEYHDLFNLYETLLELHSNPTKYLDKDEKRELFRGKLSPKPLDKQYKNELLKLQNNTDPFTGEPLKADYHCHHIWAILDGGKNVRDNCVCVNNETHEKIHRGVYGGIEEQMRKRNEFLKSLGHTTYTDPYDARLSRIVC